MPAAEQDGMDVEDGDEEGEAPDSDEEKENQRVARLREAQKQKEEAEEDNMPRAQVACDSALPLVVQNCLLDEPLSGIVILDSRGHSVQECSLLHPHVG